MRRIPDAFLRPSMVVASRGAMRGDAISAAMNEIGRQRCAFSAMLRSRRAGTPVAGTGGSPGHHEWLQKGRVVTTLTAHGRDDDPDDVETRLRLLRGRAPGSDAHQLAVEMVSMDREPPATLAGLDDPRTPWALMVCAEACLDVNERSPLEDMPSRCEDAMIGMAMEIHDAHPVAKGRMIRIHGPSPWARTAWSVDHVDGRPTPIDDASLPSMARIFVSHRTDMTVTDVVLDCYSTAIDPNSLDPMRRLRVAAALEALRNGDVH